MASKANRFLSETHPIDNLSPFCRFLQRDAKILTEDMKLGQQIVSLPLAKRLKELGVKQESCFAYYEEQHEGTS
jgi:hypothetical protein